MSARSSKTDKETTINVTTVHRPGPRHNRKKPLDARPVAQTASENETVIESVSVSETKNPSTAHRTDLAATTVAAAAAAKADIVIPDPLAWGQKTTTTEKTLQAGLSVPSALAETHLAALATIEAADETATNVVTETESGGGITSMSVSENETENETTVATRTDIGIESERETAITKIANDLAVTGLHQCTTVTRRTGILGASNAAIAMSVSLQAAAAKRQASLHLRLEIRIPWNAKRVTGSV